MAGHGDGKWPRCTLDDGVEESEGTSVPVGRRTYKCGHACPKPQHGPPSEEGRPPGDVGHLAAARFIRYMHSYSLPPREVSHSCEHCREAAGATQANESFGRQGPSKSSGVGRAPHRQTSVTFKKKDVKPGHPLLSQLLTSKQRPIQHWAQLPQPTINLLHSTKSKPEGKSSKSHVEFSCRMEKKEVRRSTNFRNKAEELELLLPPLAIDQESWDTQLDQGLDTGFGLALVWPNQWGYRDDVDHDDDGVVDDIDDDHVMGSLAAVPSPGQPSPLISDTSIAEPTPPCIIQVQGHPHRQALSEHPDDQGHPVLGNHDCIPHHWAHLCSFLLPVLL